MLNNDLALGHSMAFVYQYSSICSSGRFKHRKHKATLQLIERINGVAYPETKIEVPDELIILGIYRLPLKLRAEESSLRSWGFFKAAPPLFSNRKRG